MEDFVVFSARDVAAANRVVPKAAISLAPGEVLPEFTLEEENDDIIETRGDRRIVLYDDLLTRRLVELRSNMVQELVVLFERRHLILPFRFPEGISFDMVVVVALKVVLDLCGQNPPEDIVVLVAKATLNGNNDSLHDVLMRKLMDKRARSMAMIEHMTKQAAAVKYVVVKDERLNQYLDLSLNARVNVIASEIAAVDEAVFQGAMIDRDLLPFVPLSQITGDLVMYDRNMQSVGEAWWFYGRFGSAAALNAIVMFERLKWVTVEQGIWVPPSKMYDPDDGTKLKRFDFYARASQSWFDVVYKGGGNHGETRAAAEFHGYFNEELARPNGVPYVQARRFVTAGEHAEDVVALPGIQFQMKGPRAILSYDNFLRKSLEKPCDFDVDPHNGDCHSDLSDLKGSIYQCKHHSDGVLQCCVVDDYVLCFNIVRQGVLALLKDTGHVSGNGIDIICKSVGYYDIPAYGTVLNPIPPERFGVWKGGGLCVVFAKGDDIYRSSVSPVFFSAGLYVYLKIRLPAVARGALVMMADEVKFVGSVIAIGKSWCKARIFSGDNDACLMRQRVPSVGK